jgi:hypothetical protein
LTEWPKSLRWVESCVVVERYWGCLGRVGGGTIERRNESTSVNKGGMATAARATTATATRKEERTGKI